MTTQEKQITVSVRLREAEYKALQAAAQEEYTTMSGVLRKLLNRHFERMNNNG